MSARIQLVEMLVVAASALSIVGVAGAAEAKKPVDPIFVFEETGSVKLDAFCDLAMGDAAGNLNAGRPKVAKGVIREANAAGCNIKMYY